MIVVVPMPLTVTLPLAMSTTATFESPDLKVTVPSVVFVSVFVKAALSVVFSTFALAKLSFGAA